MKSFKAFWVFLFCSFTLFGQNNLSITGIIVDNTTKEPVDFATVSLLNAKDSSFVSGNMSDAKGVFTLRGVSKGNFLINVTYVGYKPVYKPVTLSGANATTNVGTISLATDDILLKETVVVGKVPEVVVKGDTIEYDADSFKTPQNAALEELLKKLPGAEVDKDGNITINGKEIKKILVDGKEFFSDDPKVASKNLPAEMVKKVQVHDRRSDMARLTGFDDGDEETVINLTIREGMKKGTMGNAMAGLGHDILKGTDKGNLRYETGAMINNMTDNDRYTLLIRANNTNNMGASDLGGNRFGGMRGMRRGMGGINTSENFAFNMNKEISKKLSLNGDISYNSSDRESNNITEKTYNEDKRAQNPTRLKDRTNSRNNDISDNFNVGFRMEWRPDSSTTVIFRPNFSYNKSNSTEDRDFSRFNMLAAAGKDTLFDGRSHSYNWGEGYQTGATLEFARKLNKQGRVISASINGNYNTSYSNGEYTYLKNIYEGGLYNRDSIATQQLLNNNYSTRYGFSVTYVEPIGNSNFIQASYRFNKNYSENVNSTYDLDTVPDHQQWSQNMQQSRSNVRDAITQRVNLAFKSVRAKYNYTVGLNIDPSSSTNYTYIPSVDGLQIYPATYEGRFSNIIGDSLANKPVVQNKPRFSPNVNFNYLFGPRTNLRIDYSGDMVQPTPNQLSILDVSDPMNTIKGNSALKPSYTNNFSARFSKFVPETQFFYNFDFRGSFTLSDIVEVLTSDTAGRIQTTYENVSGNWDAQLRGMFNTPLRNKKFTVSSFAMLSYRNLAGYTNGFQNTTKSFTIMDRVNVNYRSELFDLGVNGGISYQNVNNRLQPQNNRDTYDYSAGGYTTWYLPHNFTFESDISCQFRSGYNTGFNTSQTIWNAALSKQLFNSKAGAGTVKLSIYDILQDRKTLTHDVRNSFTTDRESTVLSRFFMCSFIYKFQVFPGGNASAQDMQPEGPMIIRERGQGGRGQGGGMRIRE
ncbi:MAG: outer membrane beta-barrel protein [Dysgonamonadaceae bacterium]|jgi:hypothetical protein|nr:outer membrane beta-barrel protein [Dysgonamonadaceae bacterium]